MNWKLIISITALLLTGFVAGFFTNRYMTKQIARKYANFRQAKGIENHLYKILELDAQQKTVLQPIIEQHFSELATFNQEHRLKREAMEEKFNQAIEPTLTTIQKENLAKFQKRLKRGRGKRKKNKQKKTSMGKKDN